MTFDDYLSGRGLTIAGNKAFLLVRADDFLEKNAKFCTTPPPELLEKVKYIIAFAYSAEGGGFDDNANTDGRVKTKEGLGKGSIIDEWDVVDKTVLGNDPISKLKRMGIHSLLSSYLCADSTTKTPAIMVV